MSASSRLRLDSSQSLGGIAFKSWTRISRRQADKPRRSSLLCGELGRSGAVGIEAVTPEGILIVCGLCNHKLDQIVRAFSGGLDPSRVPNISSICGGYARWPGARQLDS